MEWIIGICILVIVFLLFSKIYIRIAYSFVNNEQTGTITISFFKIPIYKKSIQPDEEQHSILQFIKNENSISDLLQEGKVFLRSLKLTAPAMYWVLQKLAIHQFSWHTFVGAGEASSTGILSGGVWSIKGVLIAFLKETCRVACSFQVGVNPYFQAKVFNSKVDMKVSIRLSQAIRGGVKILRSLSKHDEITISKNERKILNE